MNKTRNIQRYWVDNDSRIVVRKWTAEEYENINPRTHIFETFWSYYCPICFFIPTPHSNKSEAEHGATMHERYAGSKHRCIVEQRDHELVCLECREEFIKELNVWVSKQEVY